MFKRLIVPIFALLVCSNMFASCCCCLPGGSTDDSISDYNDDYNDYDDYTNTASESEAEKEVKIYLGLYLNNATLGGRELDYVSCTFDSTRKTDENTFIIKGTVTVRDEYNDTYVADYNATVEYDPEYDSYDADVDIGTFRLK